MFVLNVKDPRHARSLIVLKKTSEQITRIERTSFYLTFIGSIEDKPGFCEVSFRFPDKLFSISNGVIKSFDNAS